MPSNADTANISKKRFWIGWVITGLISALLTMSAVFKFVAPQQVQEEMGRLGYQSSQTFKLGVVELLCTLIYLFPRTAVLGAILLTGYLGGATATHVRVGDPFIPPIINGVLVWLGIYLRDRRLGDVLPLRK